MSEVKFLVRRIDKLLTAIEQRQELEQSQYAGSRDRLIARLQSYTPEDQQAILERIQTRLVEGSI